jgi:hypothetical protein
LLHPAVENRHRWVCLAHPSQVQQGTLVINDGFKACIFEAIAALPWALKDDRDQLHHWPKKNANCANSGEFLKQALMFSFPNVGHLIWPSPLISKSIHDSYSVPSAEGCCFS